MKALGDYCGGVPPLPIPNREVKTASADGTAILCGRVGRRHSLNSSIPLLGWRFFFDRKSKNPESTYSLINIRWNICFSIHIAR